MYHSFACRGELCSCRPCVSILRDSTEIQGNVAEVEPIWSVQWLVVPGRARSAGVASSTFSAMSAFSASVPSAVAQDVDPVLRAVAGRRCHLWGILHGLCGGVFEKVKNLTDCMK